MLRTHTRTRRYQPYSTYTTPYCNTNKDPKIKIKDHRHHFPILPHRNLAFGLLKDGLLKDYLSLLATVRSTEYILGPR